VAVALAVRPSFSVDLRIPSREAIERLSTELAAGTQQLRRTRLPGGGGETASRDLDHLVLTVPESQQRFWSPWLTIDLTPSDTGTLLFARFSPHPSVWTGFAFGYLTFGAGLVFSLIFAGAQAMVGGDAWPLKISAAAVLVLGALWLSARVGQRLAQAQMSALRDEVERAVAACDAPTG